MAAIPKKHKAVIYDRPGTISTQVVEVDTPEPGPGEVLVKLTHSGVCHSDFGIMTNGWPGLPHPTSAGQVGGHEGVGTVAAVGPGVSASSGDAGAVKVGDRVGIKWISAVCGACEACLAGHDGVCFHQKVSGYYTPGTFQQYVLGPASYVTPIPAALPSDVAGPLLCAGVTAYSALRKSGATPGSWVVVVGAAGGCGHLAVQLASRGMGLRVVAVDAADKRDFVMGCGAEAFVDYAREAAVQEVLSATGGLGAHAVLVCTAANSAYASAMGMLRFGGTLVCVGIPEGQMQPIATAFPQLLIAKAQKIIGVVVGDRRDAAETLQFAERGIIKTHIQTAKMEDLTNIFERMEKGEIVGRTVLDLT